MTVPSAPARDLEGSLLGRIGLVATVALAVLAGLIGSSGSVAAQDAELDASGEPQAVYYDERFAGVVVPGALGQTEEQVYVEETGHTIRGYMLDYWRAQGASSVYGNPISEPFAATNGFYSQAFEGGVFQFIPDLVWTDQPSVSLMPVGTETLASRVGNARRDGRRDGGGGDARVNAWRSYSEDSGVGQRALAEGGRHDEITGHTITGAFVDWYDDHEGVHYFGSPISQPVAERGMVVQYFTGGLLMRSAGGRVIVAPIVAEQADRIGVDTAPVDRAGLSGFSETAMWTTDNPNPLGDPNAPGRKMIEVDISDQALYAYQGSTLISSTLVSTGLDPNGTETGTFHVRYKLEKQDMEGTTGPDGEVIAVGENADELTKDEGVTNAAKYIVEDVPSVMYINMDAEALHGAYWHNNFGQRMSHGCINQPVEFANFLYGWAPLGTVVWVHE